MYLLFNCATALLYQKEQERCGLSVVENPPVVLVRYPVPPAHIVRGQRVCVSISHFLSPLLAPLQTLPAAYPAHLERLETMMSDAVKVHLATHSSE